MDHSSFVDLYRKGSLKARVDRSAAMHVCDRDPRIPGPRRAAHKMWKNIAFFLVVGGLISLFWLPWYAALSAFVIGLLLSPAVQKSAAEFVLETSLENDEFYADMLSNDVLRTSQ